MNMNIGIFVFDEVEALDFAGPYEVFTTAARLHGRARPPGAAPLFKVSAIARDANAVRARAGWNKTGAKGSWSLPPASVRASI